MLLIYGNKLHITLCLIHYLKITDGNLMKTNYDWDSCEHISHRNALIQKGCGCKTGCASNRCKCKNSDIYRRGPGCTCNNCENHPITSTYLN